MEIITEEESRLEEIYQNIKESYLSKSYFPKLMIGTGLSISYEIAGMSSLSDSLEAHFFSMAPGNLLKDQWESYGKKIVEFGLEKGLEDIDYNRNSEFIDEISTCTAKLILDDLSKQSEEIMKKDTGFKKLLKYLSNSCSANCKLVDIMTPNYDLIIELICDDLGIEIIDGFIGNVYARFNHSLVRDPKEKVHLNKKYKYVRLFKPHGSINWLSINDTIMKVNDFETIRKNIDKVSIIAPGGAKYKQGMVVTEFRNIREEFNSIISSRNTTPVLVYGYGFNDDHFNNALFENSDTPILVISKGVNSEIIEKLLVNENAVVFYEENEENRMIYKQKKYQIPDAMWNMDIFSNKIIS